jgi:hypothetical protein
VVDFALTLALEDESAFSFSLREKAGMRDILELLFFR